MEKALKKIDEGLELLHRQDSESQTFENISQGISNILIPFNEIYVEKKMLMQTLISSFFKKIPDPASIGTDGQEQDTFQPLLLHPSSNIIITYMYSTYHHHHHTLQYPDQFNH